MNKSSIIFRVLIPITIFLLFIPMNYLIKLTNSNGAVFRAMHGYALDFRKGMYSESNIILLVIILTIWIIVVSIYLIRTKDVWLIYRLLFFMLAIYMLIEYKGINEDLTYFLKVSVLQLVIILDTGIYIIFYNRKKLRKNHSNLVKVK